MTKLYQESVHVGMGVLVHVRMDVEYQKELFTFKQVSTIPLCTRSGGSWASAGTSGFKGTRRGTPYAAQAAALNAIRTVVNQGMQRAEVMIKGPGLGRDAALRAIVEVVYY
ncbi:hypothetical protein C4D60_Mb00t15310 [Musa balbisiana]|uniref:Ribosomal protein S11 n=1 Tax=Musa balbisiana TaxID=52838 RepID=A0A4S8I6T0_MUSBA|nr:hypothetical protein C4D60_Mb00t15310 [Musa balbisiana]